MEISDDAYPLKEPDENIVLYKFISFDRFLETIEKNYLYFNKVSNYPDLDPYDSDILPNDIEDAKNSSFGKNPNYTWLDLCKKARNAMYACCFSLSNDKIMWETFGEKNSICLAIKYDNLKGLIEKSYDRNKAILDVNNNRIYPKDIKLNFGLVDYIDRKNLHLSRKNLINPLRYTYLKDKINYSHEQELRITLWALKICYETLENPRNLDGLKLQINLAYALRNGTHEQLIVKREYYDSNKKRIAEISPDFKSLKLDLY